MVGALLCGIPAGVLASFCVLSGCGGSTALESAVAQLDSGGVPIPFDSGPVSNQPDGSAEPFQRDSGPISTQFEELKLVVAGGGYGPSSPDAGCDPLSPATFVVESTSQTLTWNYCDWDADAGQVVARSGSRSLSAPEFASVTGAFSRVAISHTSQCGADFPTITLDLRSSSGLSLYADDFYSDCPWGDLIGRTFVTGLSGLYDVIRQLPMK